MRNHLLRRGAKIYHERNADVHVFGTRVKRRPEIDAQSPTAQVFLCRCTANTKISYGTPNSLNLSAFQARTLKSLKMEKLIYLTPETCEIFGREGRSGRVLVDGKPEIELEDIVLRDRIQLSEEGILVPIIVLHSDIPTSTNVDDNAEKLPTDGDADDTKTALNAGQIEIISRGFVYMDKSEELIEEAKEITRKVIENLSDEQKHETEIVPR